MWNVKSGKTHPYPFWTRKKWTPNGGRKGNGRTRKEPSKRPMNRFTSMNLRGRVDFILIAQKLQRPKIAKDQENANQLKVVV